MKWLVEISYIPKNDRLLRQLLADEMFRIIELQQTFYLVGNKFEALFNHSDVYALAIHVKSIIEEVDYWEPLMTKFDVRCVLEDVDGEVLKKYGYTDIVESISVCESVTASVSIRVDVTKEEQQRIENEQKEIDYQNRYRKANLHFASSFSDDRARLVQRLLRNELTPHTMGHILDIIEDDMGGAIIGLTTNRQLTRFSRSINHPEVFGEHARHIVSKQEPPPHPMDLDEAREYIKSVASKWLERKASLRVNR
jgi:hypothetical protein